MARNSVRKVVRRSDGEVLIPSAHWCNTHLSRLRGLQFHPKLKPGEAIILSKESDGKTSSSIHMFFVFFPIAAIWVNSLGRVTSAQLARPWRPYYASPEPARFVIEAPPELLQHIFVGDEVDFV
jgi:uncharacterized membrane protein (UPF0127 family)